MRHLLAGALAAAGQLAAAAAASASHHPSPHAALAAAVRNATSDLDEFVAIVADWFEGRDAAERDAFAAFLAVKAVR